ncbi:zinc finger protein 41-like [Liolophura sinensis]|uniref:zinc finger protein 41-like n=1 Tax=Liolophura sinensis TaxID=3198878 RepID=UPI00315969ED
MSELQTSAVAQPTSTTVGIGYSDHEYEKAVHVLVERSSSSSTLSQTQNQTCQVINEVQAQKTVPQTKGDGGKPDGLLYVPEVQDTFSCGVCGKLYNKLLPFLSHRIQYAQPDRGMACELGESCPIYYQPFRLREHYKKVHKLDLPDGLRPRSCRSAYRRKPPGGSGPSKVIPGKRQKSQSRRRSKKKQKEEAPEEEGCDGTGEGESELTAAVTVENAGHEIEIHDNQGMAHNSDVAPDNSSAVTQVQVGQTAQETNIIQIETMGPDGNISYDRISVQVLPQEPEQNQANDTQTMQKSPEKSTTEKEPMKSAKEDTAAVGSNKELDFYFLLVTSMVRGSSFMYGKQSFKCLHCDYKTFWKQAFIKHMKDNHTDVLSQHEFIEMRSTEKNSDQKLMKMSEFVEHQAVGKRRETLKTIRVKDRMVDKHGNYPCTNCSKVFNKWSYLRKHMRIHVPTKNFLCIECGKAFKTNTSLQQHLKTHQKEAYTCSVCGFKSNINAAIHAHRQFHSQGSVLCDICGNAYTDKSTLNKHKRVHDPSRPFGCPYPECTWRFKTEVMCNGHYRAHTSNAQFKCTLCGYQFRQKHHLRRHERQTHGIQHLKSRQMRSKAKVDEEARAVTNITVLQPSLDPGQLPDILIPVTADADGNPIPIEYKMANLGSMNISYQQVMPAVSTLHKVDGNTVYIPLS